MVDLYEQAGGNVISIEECARTRRTNTASSARARNVDGGFGITGMVEKPATGTAPSNLFDLRALHPAAGNLRHPATPGKRRRRRDPAHRRHAELAESQAFYGYTFTGRTFDCGSREGFIKANVAFAMYRTSAWRRNCARNWKASSAISGRNRRRYTGPQAGFRLPGVPGSREGRIERPRLTRSGLEPFSDGDDIARWTSARIWAVSVPVDREAGLFMTETRSGLPVLGFADQRSLERWLAAQPGDAAGVWIKFVKKAATGARLTKAEAIDAALCHGWIDGKLEKYDNQHWLVRFTPRKSRSKWSALNRNRVLTLIKEGRMRPAGFAQIEAAKADGRWERATARRVGPKYPSTSRRLWTTTRRRPHSLQH